jgi:exopolyphosphatase/guanosine-5'-triphosphate,3'-diphosphate pyrophosphatase
MVRDGARAARSPVLAAIDLGTNNCRLLIAKFSPDGALEVVDSFSRIVRLGEGVAQSGRLSEAAIERTLGALKICGERVRKAHADAVRAIATEAARRASNASVLIQRAEKEAGVKLEIISAEEEAHLAAVGCAPLIGDDYQGAIVFDVGGGSTEIVRMEGHGTEAHEIHTVSVPVGVIVLVEKFGYGRDAIAMEQMRTFTLGMISEAWKAAREKSPFDTGTHHLLGTSGTVTTLAGIALGLKRYERARVDGSWHECARILEITRDLAGLSLEGRAEIGCVGSERAELIVPGSAIFSAVHALRPCEKLRVADRGLREGMLRELARA